MARSLDDLDALGRVTPLIANVRPATVARHLVTLGVAGRVSADVSVVGYDDIDLATVVDPPLTTICVPHRRMERAAADMLLRTIAGAPVNNRLLDFEVVERRSFSPPAWAQGAAAIAEVAPRVRLERTTYRLQNDCYYQLS